MKTEKIKTISSNLNKGFVMELLRLAEMVVDADGDTIDFTLAEKDGIRMDVSITFSYTKIEED